MTVFRVEKKVKMMTNAQHQVALTAHLDGSKNYLTDPPFSFH
jgi:hypothetical protein